MLQEARQRAEEEREGSGAGEGHHQERNQETFETAWDRTEGVVHLEALSLVSRQCETKMATLINTFPHYILDVVHRNNAKIKVSAYRQTHKWYFLGTLVQVLQ